MYRRYLKKNKPKKPKLLTFDEERKRARVAKCEYAEMIKAAAVKYQEMKAKRNDKLKLAIKRKRGRRNRIPDDK